MAKVGRRWRPNLFLWATAVQSFEFGTFHESQRVGSVRGPLNGEEQTDEPGQ